MLSSVLIIMILLLSQPIFIQGKQGVVHTRTPKKTLPKTRVSPTIKPHDKTMYPADELRFVFIVPSYNNAAWYKKNIESMLTQNYSNYHIIYIDDASTDETGILVEELVRQHQAENKVTLIKNPMRLGIMANRYTAINLCNDGDICIALDGDDWLPHQDVLRLYNTIYHRENIWITYGRYLEYPILLDGHFAKVVPKNILRYNRIRHHPWSCSHLKTFRAWLFKKIKLEDLLMNGTFIPAATDLAMMFPMMEMAQYHSLFVKEVTCIYNNINPLGVIRQKSQIHLQCNHFLRSKKAYKPLKAAPCLT